MDFEQRNRSRSVSPWVMAGAALVIAVAIRVVMFPLLGISAPYLAFAPAVAIGAFFGGFAVGAVTTAISSAIVLLFMSENRFEVSPAEFGQMALFVLAGFILAFLGQARLRWFLRAQSAICELARSERHVQNVLNSLSVFVGVLKPDGTMVDANAAALGAANLSLPDVVGKPFAESYWWSYSPEAQEKLRTSIEKAASGTSSRYDVELRLSETHRIITDFVIAPVLGENGEVEYLVASAIDVTERTRFAEALQRSESELRRLVDSNIVGVAYTNEDGRVTGANGEFLRMIGRSRQELASGTIRWDELTPPEFGRTDRRHIKEALERGACAPYEKEYLHKDGRRVPIIIGYALLPDSRTDYICFILDLTKRKEAQRQLRDAEMRLRFHAENSPLAVIEWDREFRLTSWNARAEEMFGWMAGEVLGKLPTEWPFVYPDDVSDVEGLIRDLRSGAALRNTFTNRNLTKSGSVLYCSWFNSALIGDEGLMSSAQSLVQDVTPERQAAEAMIAARDTAESANRAKDDFLATLSHELRTPMTSLMGWLGLLRMSMLGPEEQTHALDQIEQSATSQMKIIEEILDMSRLVTGKLSLEMRPIVLSDLVSTACDSMAPTFARRQVSLEYSSSDRLLIIGDENRLRQVIFNLLSNAAKFTPAGGSVRVRAQERDGSAELTVTDSGIGIDPEIIGHIFDRFIQAENTEKRRHGGLGLGLSIAKQLVEAHGGSLTAESEGPSKGSRFTVRLRLAR